jgi:hypothetical protein
MSDDSGVYYWRRLLFFQKRFENDGGIHKYISLHRFVWEQEKLKSMQGNTRNDDFCAGYLGKTPL